MTARVTTTVAVPADAFTVVLPSPEMISQINVAHVFGLPARTYLELLREADCPIVVTPVGKLRLSDCRQFRGWLERRGGAKRAAAMAPEDVEATLTVDEQVALGIRPVPPPTPTKRR
jgi:hypothetical protein